MNINITTREGGIFKKKIPSNVEVKRKQKQKKKSEKEKENN